MEVELKLLVDAQYEDAILRHPLLSAPAGSQPRELNQMDTYFDTPEFKLRERHIGLRVRRARGRWIQNIKGNGKAESGLHSRHEWERPIAGPIPELDHLRTLIDDKTVRRGLATTPALKKRLTPVFATKVKRTAWDVQLDDGGQVECALDRGTLECGDKKIAISELELELKSGDPRQLFDLALELQQTIPLRVGNDSKADRGYALLLSQPEGAVKAARPALSASMSAGEAFIEIAANCLSHMQSNDQRVAYGSDVESLHQMRVGMRRLRSALNMYKALLQLPPPLQTELDWLAGELGEARDWDVLAGSTLPMLAQQADGMGQIDGVRQAVQEQAQAQRRRTAEAVDSPRYTRLMLGISRWVHAVGRGAAGAAGAVANGNDAANASTYATNGGAAAAANNGAGSANAGAGNVNAGASGAKPAANKLDQPVLKFARKILQRDQKRLRRRARHLADASPAMRHRLRIAAKKTRYAAEFFSALFAPRVVKRYVQGLSRLQDELGQLNDFAVAGNLLNSLSAAEPQLEGEVGFVKGYLAAQERNDSKKVLKLWKQFAPVTPPH